MGGQIDNIRVATFLNCTLLLAFLFAPCVAQSFQISGWNAVWQDEFNGTSVDHSRWEVAYRENSPNNEEQFYLPDQVSVSGGQLHIEASNQPMGSKPYRSGLVRTWEEHRYGRWEVRADLPWGQGMWPAIWLLPRDLGTAPWPTGGEIDIMENVGNNTFFVKGSYHYNYTPGTPITSNADYITGEDFAAGMHDYAVEWEPGAIRFYVDDNLYHTVENPIQPQEMPMSLIINLAVGGDWPGSPDGSTVFPQTFDIEYARYWRRNETELINPDFDRSGSTINGWNVFGNEIGNVSAATEAVLDGTHSMKLFGQFSNNTDFSGASQGILVVPGQDIIAEASAFINSQDSISGTGNGVQMKLEYYSTFGGTYGGSEFLGEEVIQIADGSSSENIWLAHQISDVVPENAVEARVSFVFSQSNNDGGAVHIDAVSLVATDPVAIDGDYNNDGVVDAADYTVWRDNLNTVTNLPGDTTPGLVTANDYSVWSNNYGATNNPSASNAVPEPPSILVLAFSLAGSVLNRRSA